MKLAYYQSIDPSDPLPKLGRKVDKCERAPTAEEIRAQDVEDFESGIHFAVRRHDRPTKKSHQVGLQPDGSPVFGWDLVGDTQGPEQRLQDLQDLKNKAMSDMAELLASTHAKLYDFTGSGAATYASIPQGEHVTLTTNAALDGGWIAWGGGECPVVESSTVDIRFRGGSMYEAQDAARGLRWDHIGCSADIIAYRIHKQPEATWGDVIKAHDAAMIRNVGNTSRVFSVWRESKRDDGPLALQPECWPVAIAALEALK